MKVLAVLIQQFLNQILSYIKVKI